MAEQGMSNAPPPGPQVEEGVGGEGLEEEELYEVNEAGEMLLENSWVFFFDEGPPKGTQLKSYQAVQKTLGTFTSVQVSYSSTKQPISPPQSSFPLNLIKCHHQIEWS